MHVSPVKIISFLSALMALGIHILPANAQDTLDESPVPERPPQIDTLLASADVADSRLDLTRDGLLTPLKATSSVLTENSMKLTDLPLKEDSSPKATPISGFKAEAQNDSTTVERPGPPIRKFVSRLNQSMHFPMLRQTTIANILVDLKKKYGPECMTQAGNFHWFFNSQRTLATGDKTNSLVACSKMSRWSSLCASTDTKTFTLYFTGF
jgi:hypothetical protein